MARRRMFPAWAAGLLAAALILAGCAAPPHGDGDGGADAFTFWAPETIDAIAGTEFLYSFCDPQPATPTSACGPFPETLNPQGGQPPYHFQLGSGTGFPPMGVTLSKDGILAGYIPPASGGRDYPILVCAVDVAADQVCRDVLIVVEAAPECAGDVYADTHWAGRVDVGSANPPQYSRAFDFRFGTPDYYDGGGCFVPVAETHVDDATYPWELFEDDFRVSGMDCFDACDEFHLYMYLPDGPPLEELGGGNYLQMNAVAEGFTEAQRISEDYIGGDAGTGAYTGGCCWPGEFTANRT